MADKKRIRLKDFFATGALDCINLGQSEEWVARHFPAPEEEPYQSFGEPGVRVWNYGGLEFFFQKNPAGQSILATIFCDFLHFSMGKSFIVHKWFLKKNPDAVSVRKVVEELNTERMEFSVVRNPVWVENSVIIELAKSHVCLLFEAEDNGQDTNDFKLQAFYTK